MRLLFASLFATALLASTACSGDETPADEDDDDDTTSSSSGSSSGRAGSSSGGSSSGKSSSSSGGSSSGGSGSSSSSGGSSSGEPDAGPVWPGPSGTAIAAGTIEGTTGLSAELATHLVATGADDGSFALMFFADPEALIGGAYVQKRTQAGAVVWTKELEYSPSFPATGLAMDEAGNVYVAVNAQANNGVDGLGPNIPNVREAQTTYIDECLLARLGSADGAKAWHGHVTLRTGLTEGDARAQCTGIAVRGDQVVVTGNYQNKAVYYVDQNGTEVLASGHQADNNGAVSQSFALSVAAATGVANQLVSLTFTSSAAEFSTDGIGVSTDGRALLHGLSNAASAKVGTAAAGELIYTPTANASRDPFYQPLAFLDLRAAPVTGRLEATETYHGAQNFDPLTFFPQAVPLPDGAALFGLVLQSATTSTFRPPNAGTTVAMAAQHTYFALTTMPSDSAPGATRLLDFGQSSEYVEHRVATGKDGSVVVAGLHDLPLELGDACNTGALTAEGGYLVSFGTDVAAGCKFAVPMPAGVLPARVAVGPDGRIVVAGLYSAAATFGNGVTLPEPDNAVAPFFVTFVP